MTPNRRVTMANHIERRKFLATLGGAAAAWPVGARTQQPKVPTIVALVIGNISPEQFWREFRQGLRDLGYVEGQNIRFEFRSAEGHLDRLPELAAELVRLKVDIIVTWFTPTTLAAKQATREIPIVMADTGDPVGMGLVASLPRPAGNVTCGTPRDRSGQCERSLLQTFPRTGPTCRRSQRNYDQPRQDQQQRGVRGGFRRDGEGAARCRDRSTQPAEQTRRRAGAQASCAGGFSAAVVRRGRRADVVLREILLARRLL